MSGRTPSLTHRRALRAAGITLMCAVAAIGFASTSSVPAGAAPVADFLLETHASGFTVPTDLAFAPNGLLFVAEKSGLIKVVDRAGAATVFADLRADVNDAGERGLLGIVVHPNFVAGSPYVYALHSYDPPQAATAPGNAARDGDGQRVSRLVRLTANAATGYTTMVTGSSTTILGNASTWTNTGDPNARDSDQSTSWACGRTTFVADCLPSDGRSHSIGTVAFGPDGMLYVGNGDASDFSNADPRSLRALDVNSPAGKILRVDPDTGLGLPDNPHWNGDATTNASRVYVSGLRNPYRFSFGGGSLWIGDVGEGDWEEVNRGVAGASYGWPCYEGGAAGTATTNAGFNAMPTCISYIAGGTTTAPTWSYAHGAGGAAIVVGDMYEGTSWPAEFQGALIVGDFVQQSLQAVRVNGAPITSAPLATDLLASDAEFGPDGHLYVSGLATGVVQRIRYAPGEQLPGALRVTTSPAVPAKIVIDGAERANWGIDWMTLSAGNHQLCVTDVPGFVTPPCQSVEVASGLTTEVVFSFEANAVLSVSTRTSAGVTGVPSRISIDGVPAGEWGVEVGRGPGVAEVCFGAVAGFEAPACRTVTLTAGARMVVDGVFTPSVGAPGLAGPLGQLRVATSPAVPSTMLLDGIPISTWSVNWVRMPPGQRTVCFTDVPGYTTPPCRNVTITAGMTTNSTATFEPRGTLRVTTSPPSGVTISVDGVDHNQWGLFADAVPGTHEVCAAFRAGPACARADVTAGAVTSVVLSPPVPFNQPPLVSAGVDITIVDTDGSGSEEVPLDGNASHDPDGTLVASVWTESGAELATGLSPTVSFAVGTHTVQLDVTDDRGAIATDTVVVTVESPPPPPPTDLVHLSTTTDGIAGGLAFADEDIVTWSESTGTWTMLFDGSDVGLGNSNARDIDAFTIMPDGSLLMSTTSGTFIPDVGSIDDSDLVRFVPTSLGPTTAGTWSMWFDGSDVGLTTNEENIDSIEMLEDGTFVVGIAGDGSVTGATTVGDHDLLRFGPSTLGATTTGTWEMWFDGSDVEFAAPTEGVVGVSMPRAGTVYLSTRGAFTAGATTGDGMDVVSCSGPVTGDLTSCASTERFWDGSTKGLTGMQIDGMQLRPV
jgi:glucose/arabinose dehydrogenase